MLLICACNYRRQLLQENVLYLVLPPDPMRILRYIVVFHIMYLACIMTFIMCMHMYVIRLHHHQLQRDVLSVEWVQRYVGILMLYYVHACCYTFVCITLISYVRLCLLLSNV